MCKVSVIVPVYNVEKYLPECIDSLLKQTFEDVEFIFVNDGSTDLSSNILEKYKELDQRIIGDAANLLI
ncbi:glycosyltransferase family 2 protein [Escherichia coli]|uniref:glycosyltransferase family 2 protein n=2 Tax=Escherichia coli TaxID=562 RepID=UPI0004D3F8F0|nr:glycosyltransferase family 2 protein [Escherichia coli]KEL56936.1 glycosyl transferase 2 family protein [Escherichia coli 5-172-05_S1_C3]MBZ6049531.1 glycosyltransferase [Escherichia coli]MCC5591812.1 glycosyltransferase [Escherichia coli]MCI3788786.1 glycosyltransferase [Escherichia coli]MCT9676007.1 glycosyltransferase [Escherichia coli]